MNLSSSHFTHVFVDEVSLYSAVFGCQKKHSTYKDVVIFYSKMLIVFKKFSRAFIVLGLCAAGSVDW